MHAIPVLPTSLRPGLAPVLVALAYGHPIPAAFILLLARTRPVDVKSVFHAKRGQG